MRSNQIVTISLWLPKLVERLRWRALLAYGRRKAEAASIRTEEDVERLIDEIRR